MNAVKRRIMWFSLLGVTLIGCRITDVPIWDVPKSSIGDGHEVREISGLVYRDEKGADRVLHRLDLFVPKDRSDFPVIMLVHGGAWLVGDNRCCGLYSSVGKYLASRGVGVVMPNYRLSPGVRHPEHVKDVARAVAWTKEHIAEFGGDANKLFLMGHSAGGHLVSLLTTDEQYLQAEGLTSADIRGVIAVSGVYRITPGKFEATLGGEGPLSFRLDSMSPLRGDNLPRWAHVGRGAGVPFTIDIFGPAFGPDPAVREAASPIAHVRPELPPFLIFNAENDLPALSKMAEEFQAALEQAGGEARRIRVPNRNHNSIIFRAIEHDDPVARETLVFVNRLSHISRKIGQD